MNAWSDGDCIGEYQLGRLIGSGGSGLVFLARHVRVGHRVVIKLRRPDRDTGEQRARFLRESQALARLAHPSIVRLLHADTLEDGTEYMVLEHAGGVSLREVLRARGAPLAVSEVASILWQLATALSYVHSCGIVHRDVKPENLVVRTDSEPPGRLASHRITLIDFGLAWLGAPAFESGPPWPADLTQLDTSEGARPGTPPYRAPELGMEANSHSASLDVYALGVLGWELLSGRHPSSLDHATAIAQLLELRPQADRSLVRLIAALLSPVPQARPDLKQVARCTWALAQVGAGRQASALSGAAESVRKFAQRLPVRHLSIKMVAIILTVAAGLAFLPGRRLARLASMRPEPTFKRSKPPPVLVIAQPANGVLQDEAIVAALAPQQVVSKRVDIAPGDKPSAQLNLTEWETLAEKQVQLIRSQILPALHESPNLQLAYFGRAPVPLAIHLGTQLSSAVPIAVFQQSHRGSSWQWPATDKTQDVVISGLPISVRSEAGPVVLRVSTFSQIDPQLTREIIATPLCEIDVAVAVTEPDALRSEADVNEVAGAVLKALYAIATKLPHTTAVHLFAAVPGGLALRIGTVVNPKVYPPIWTYDFDRNLRPQYRRALLLTTRPEPKESDPMPVTSPPLIERRLEHFVDWLKPDPETESAMARQAHEIRDRIRVQAVQDKLTVRSTPSAGSFAKNTGLRRHVTGGSAVDGQDVDIPFVLAPMTEEDQRISRLLDRFQGYADRAYPQRPPYKSRTKSSIKISFEGSKLSYDLVPMIQASEFGDDYQWLLRGDGSKRLTSVIRHNGFITRRTNDSNQRPGRVKFNECVRLLKWWREFRMNNDRRSIPGIPSLMVEMLAAYAFDKKGIQTTYSETLLSWFDFLHGVVTKRQRVGFSDYPNPRGRRHAEKSPWMVIEAIDPENNLTHDWIDQHIDELASWLQRGREDMQNSDRPRPARTIRKSLFITWDACSAPRSSITAAIERRASPEPLPRV